MTEAPLELLFSDPNLVAVNKPSGMMVHRSTIAGDAQEFVLQRLRDHLGQRVYPVHRLDRPTSGVLLFALNSETAAALVDQFSTRGLSKSYLALVRGWFPAEVDLDHPLKPIWDPYGDRGKRKDKPAQEARTRFACLAQAELPVAIGRYSSSRYSLVRACPATGRKHQIRRHLKHLSHPILGDVKYGKGPHNRLFRERWGIEHLLLHAESLCFSHPVSGEPVSVRAPLRAEFQYVVEALDWSPVASEAVIKESGQ